MKTLAFRIFGHGVIGEALTVTTVTAASSTVTLTLSPASAVNWSTRAWSFVVVSGCSPRLADGRYIVTGGSTTAITLVATGTAGAVTGNVWLDDCYTFAERLPVGIGSDTATRWSLSLRDATNSIGSTIDPVGGVAESDGLTIELAYSSHAAVTGLCRAVPLPVFESTGAALLLAARLPRASTLAATGTPGDSGFDAAVPTLTDGSQLWLDNECLQLVTDTGPGEIQIRRGVLGTGIAGHAFGIPLSVGIPSAIGRECEVVVYENDDPASVSFRIVGELTDNRMAQGATVIQLEVTTDLIRPVAQRPATDALTSATYIRRPDGTHTVSILQSNPDSYWSWCEFGPIAVRIRHRTDLDTADALDSPSSLGFVSCVYELPPGLTFSGVVISDPGISREDAARLLGNQVYSRPGQIRPGSTEVSATSGALDVQRDDSWWTNTDGTWRTDGRGLYELHTPIPVHVVESAGVHADGITDPLFLDVQPGISPDAVTQSVLATIAATQVLISTGGSADGLGGAHGANDLLPAELACGIPSGRVAAINVTSDSALGRVVLRATEESIAESLTSQVLRPAALSLAQASDGSIRIVNIATLAQPLVAIQITDADIYSDPGSAPDIEGPSDSTDFLVQSYVVRKTTLRNADIDDEESRTINEFFAGSAGFTAGNGSYGRVKGRMESVTVWGSNAPQVAAQFIQQTYGVMRKEVTLTTGPQTGLEAGAIIVVSLDNIPGEDGTRGFTGLAIILSRITELRNTTVRVRLLLIGTSPNGTTSWAPGLPVDAVTDAESFTLDTSENIHLRPFTEAAGAPRMQGPAFNTGDKVNIYTGNLSLRSTSAPGTVSGYDDTTGVMTLSTAATDGGGDVIPDPGDIVTLAAFSTQPGNSRAKDDFAYFGEVRWQ
jgi:hypothetical protein